MQSFFFHFCWLDFLRMTKSIYFDIFSYSWFHRISCNFYLLISNVKLFLYVNVMIISLRSVLHVSKNTKWLVWLIDRHYFYWAWKHIRHIRHTSQVSMSKKCPNTEFFLARISCIWTEYVPDITPCLDNFPAVFVNIDYLLNCIVLKLLQWLQEWYIFTTFFFAC